MTKQHDKTKTIELGMCLRICYIGESWAPNRLTYLLLKRGHYYMYHKPSTQTVWNNVHMQSGKSVTI